MMDDFNLNNGEGGDMTDREKQLIMDRQKAEEEFGKMRAKFKDLYLKKEGEAMEAREAVAQMSEEMSDVRTAALMAQTNAQEEINIASLHYNEEIRSLKLLLQEANNQCEELRYNEQRRDEGGRSSREGRSDSRSRSDSVRAEARARSESGNRASPSESTEDLENSMLKAQQDTQMLKSIIVPLENELAEVKLQCQNLTSENLELRRKCKPVPQPPVDMLLCLDDGVEVAEPAGGEEAGEVPVEWGLRLEELEEELEAAQCKLAEAGAANSSLETAHCELQATASSSNEIVTSLQIKLEEKGQAIAGLNEELAASKKELEDIKLCISSSEEKWKGLSDKVNEKLGNITEEFDHARDLHNTLNESYTFDKTQIDQQFEVLAEARTKLESEVSALKVKLQDERTNHEDAQALLTQSLEACRREILRLESVSDELKLSKEMNDKLQIEVVEGTERLAECQSQSREVMLGLQKQLLQLTDEKGSLQAALGRTQRDLSESLSVRDELAVQSTELQMQLEQQKELLRAIKWEHEDDVTHCGRCDIAFSMTRRKSHCRKCGRIFCSDCCSKTIEAGENRRTYKVCDECATRHSEISNVQHS